MKTILHVEGMSCEHCIEVVTDTVKVVSGVTAVHVDLPHEKVTIEHNGADVEKIKKEIEDQGYDVMGELQE